MKRDLEKVDVFYLKEDEKGFRLDLYNEEIAKSIPIELRLDPYDEEIARSIPRELRLEDLSNTITMTDLAALLNRCPARSLPINTDECTESLGNIPYFMDNEVEEQEENFGMCLK